MSIARLGCFGSTLMHKPATRRCKECMEQTACAAELANTATAAAQWQADWTTADNAVKEKKQIKKANVAEKAAKKLLESL